MRNVDRLYQYFVALKNLEVKCNFYCSVNNNKSEGDKASCSQVTLIRSFFFYVLVLKMMIYVISFIGTPVLEKIVEKKYVGIDFPYLIFWEQIGFQDVIYILYPHFHFNLSHIVE